MKTPNDYNPIIVRNYHAFSKLQTFFAQSHCHAMVLPDTWMLGDLNMEYH